MSWVLGHQLVGLHWPLILFCPPWHLFHNSNEPHPCLGRPTIHWMLLKVELMPQWLPSLKNNYSRHWYTCWRMTLLFWQGFTRPTFWVWMLKSPILETWLLWWHHPVLILFFFLVNLKKKLFQIMNALSLKQTFNRIKSFLGCVNLKSKTCRNIFKYRKMQVYLIFPLQIISIIEYFFMG